MALNKLSNVISLVFVAIIAMFLYCDLPDDPANPHNTAISAVIKTPDGKIHSHSLIDTVNKEYLVGGALRLPDNIDSIWLVITFKEDTLLDTMFTEYGKVGSYFDTIWVKRIFPAPGIYYVTFIPFTQLTLEPITANITMVETEDMPENHQPLISISGNTILLPGDTCMLMIKTTDPDTNQTSTVTINNKPDGAIIKNDTFTWAVPEDHTGRDTIRFIVKDTGYPQKSDTEVVVITVTVTPHPPAIAIRGSFSVKPLETCTLFIETSDEDDGQELTVSMEGNPEGSYIKDDSLFIWKVPEQPRDGYEEVVAFTVADDGSPSLKTTVHITLTVAPATKNRPPVWNSDTISVSLNDTSLYVLRLDEICNDPDNDELKYTLLSGSPDGDAIEDDEYTLNAVQTATGTHYIRIVVTDPDDENDTLILKISVESASSDTTPPEITFIAPPEDSGIVTSSKYTIDLFCSDASGITSVDAVFGSRIISAALIDGHYKITISGLERGVHNLVTLNAVDASENKNKRTVSVYLFYKMNYTVTYNGNGETAGAVPVDENTYDVEDVVTIRANSGNLVKTDATFTGWNTRADGSGDFYTAGETFVIDSGNVILYAQWTTNPTYTIKYDGNGNTDGDVPLDNNKYESGTTITTKTNSGNLTKTGAAFAGWNTRADGSGDVYNVGASFTIGSENVILYAQWTTNPTYIITYDRNGATSGEVPVDNNNYESEVSVVVKINSGNLKKTASTFTGWNTKADGTGNSYLPGSKLTIATSDVTLFAMWAANPTYNVSYDGNGNTDGEVPVDDNTYESGTTVTVKINSGNLVKTGATFSGWNTKDDGSGKSFATGSILEIGKADVTLYAQWTTNPTYTITYDGNGATSGKVPVDGNNYESGTKVMVKANTGNLGKSGAIFTKWNNEADCSGASYATGSELIVGSENVTLYAQWTNVYTITFDKNDAAATGTMTGQTIVSGETANLTKIGFSKPGATFKGWATSKTGDVAFDDEDSYKMGTANVTLYAVWVINNYKITFYPNDAAATGTMDDQLIASGASANLTANAFKKPGATFAGWATGSGGEIVYQDKATFTMKTENVKLYAKWTSNYTLNITISPTGGGEVTKDKTGDSYEPGTKVTLTASPKSGYRFKGWSGDASGSETEITVTMDGNKKVTANFTQLYTLSITSSPSDGGSVTKDKDGETFESGTKVTLTAKPVSGYQFKGWSGDASGSETEITVTMDGNKKVTANFVQLYTLRVTVSPTESGSVDKSPAGDKFDAETEVTLTATAKSGYRFDNWSGDASSTGKSVTVIMTEDKAVTANFVKQYTLTVSTDGKGTVTGSATVDAGTETPVTATPNSGLIFKGWTVVSGQATINDPTAASTKVKVEGDAEVKAKFGGVTFAKQVQLSDCSSCDFRDVIQTDDGGYLLISSDAHLVKMTSEGDVSWVKPVYTSWLNSISKTNDSYIISGTYSGVISDTERTYPEMSGYAQNGNNLWLYSFHDTLQYSNGVIALQTKDNSYVLGGYNTFGYFIVKTDINRNMIWNKSYEITASNLHGCRPTRDGGYILVGSANMYGASAIKVNEIGEIQWQDDFNLGGTGNNSYSFTSVDTSIDGTCIVVGSWLSGTNPAFMLELSLDKTVKKFTKYAYAKAFRSVATTKTGDIFLLGETIYYGEGGDDIYLIKSNSEGEIVNYSTFGTNSDDYGRSVKIARDGGCIIVGSNNWVIKTDENGMVE